MIPRRHLMVLAPLVVFALAGCQTFPGGQGRAALEESRMAVEQARRTGAASREPYEFAAAEQFLALSQQARRAHDKKGIQAYSALALQHAQAALGDNASLAPPVEPANPTERMAALESARQRFGALSPEKAAVVAPVVYADIAAWMKYAEDHADKRDAWRAVANASQAMDALDKQDSDGDGVTDLLDGAPFSPEDKDGFQDDDGAPDPDNDGDGVPDIVDKAPNAPETVNRWMDEDGAPDTVPVLGAVYFAEGSATPAAEQRGYLRGVALLLSAVPALQIGLVGHTDNTHSDTYNMDLAKRCTDAVRRALLEQGVGAERIHITLAGASQPAGDNATDVGRAMNRRVELRLE